jgi:two-component system phosphate regulon sensor histidine kinase PhoR
VAILSEEDPEYPAIDQLCEELGTKGNFRITCILPDGRVVGDSAEDVRKMENHADRPEIRAALQGNRGSNVRRSATLNRMMMYAAVPLQHEGELYGVLRSAVSMERLQDKLSSLIWRIGFAAIFIAAAAALAAYRISRSVEIPLESIKEKAVQMSRGDLSVRSTPFVLQELDELAGAMNRMAEQLQERIETISKQSQREDLTLSNLMDGVMTLDERERIVSLNPSAAALLMINPRQAPGLHWQDAVRDPKIREFLRSCLAEKRPYAETVIGDEKRGTFLRLRFGTIRGAEGAAEQNLGSLLLLQDVTQAKRMEIMRRDFVASVSHELRTPVTAIQGYVETLIDDKESLPSHTRDFLETIRRHSSRLINIVEDLLSLSRIEYQSERGEIGFSVENLADWLPAALETCRDRSKERNISLDLESEEQLPAYINGQLISQAVSNLIDNAVKYSPRGSRVQVKAFASDSHYLAVSVSDEGPGIAREHHDRLFERFYRVDKDRSRESGGTGLGLSIVKHIVQAHGGSVTVESEPGAGSTFTFYLPRQTAVR